MKEQYIITQSELREKGLNLSDYALDETYIPALIDLGVSICIDRICELCDNIQFEEDIEEKIDENLKLVNVFKKLQYRIIYNLIFTTEDNPVDQSIDSIIAHQLNIGKINGFQKGLYYKHN